MSEVRYQMGYARSIDINVEQVLVQYATTIVSAANMTRKLLSRGWRILHITKNDKTPLDEVELDAFAVLVSRNTQHGTQS